ncbi:MAG TPA: DUF3372 domain-containing protein, partial [Burkholderiaceae bacterium]
MKIVFALFVISAPVAALAEGACEGPFQTVLQASAEPGDAQALSIGGDTVLWPGKPAEGRYRLRDLADAQNSSDLRAASTPVPPGYRYAGAGAVLRVNAPPQRVRALLRGQPLLEQIDEQGRAIASTGLQHAAALDALYPAAERVTGFGARPSARRTGFKLWAPTARKVALCVYAGARTQQATEYAMRRDGRTGVWSAALPGDLSGRYYRYAVDVHVRGVGLVRNRVSDPYAVSGNADGERSYIARLSDAALKPPGWDATPRPRVAAQTDMA